MNECDSHKLATMSLIVCVAHVLKTPLTSLIY